MKTKNLTLPSQYPITLAEAKKQCEIDDDDTAHDTFVKGLVMAATSQAEQYLHRRLVTQSWNFWLDCWPIGESILLPFGRLQYVSSVKYTDYSGDQATMSTDDYIVDTESEIGLVVLGYNKTWPAVTLYPSNPIEIEFTCGYYIGSTWIKSTGYATAAQTISITENGLVYQATVGTSDTTEPVWPLTISGTVVDNDITWTCIGIAIPEPIRQAIKLRVSDLFENRETEVYIPNHFTLKTWEALLFPYKLWGGVF